MLTGGPVSRLLSECHECREYGCGRAGPVAVQSVPIKGELSSDLESRSESDLLVGQTKAYGLLSPVQDAAVNIPRDMSVVWRRHKI